MTQTTTDSSISQSDSLTWEASLSMLGNAVLIKQLALVLGIGALSVVCLLTALQAFDGELTLARLGNSILIGLAILVGLLLLGVVAILLFYGNRYEYRYTVSPQGVEAVTVSGTRKRNRVINSLLMLSGRPTAMGAGMLAEAGQSQMLKWADIDGLVPDQRRQTIALRHSHRTVMLVQCTPENYEQVLSRFNQSLKR